MLCRDTPPRASHVPEVVFNRGARASTRRGAHRLFTDDGHKNMDMPFHFFLIKDADVSKGGQRPEDQARVCISR